MNWCFATINGRLAEIYFEDKPKLKFLGHTYIKNEDYTSKKEKLLIEKDLTKYRFTYRKGVYEPTHKAQLQNELTA